MFFWRLDYHSEAAKLLQLFWIIAEAFYVDRKIYEKLWRIEVSVHRKFEEISTRPYLLGVSNYLSREAQEQSSNAIPILYPKNFGIFCLFFEN